MKLTFGKYRGQEIRFIQDESYIRYLAYNNQSPTKTFNVPKDIEEEALKILEEKKKPLLRFYKGIESDKIEYYIEFSGDEETHNDGYKKLDYTLAGPFNKLEEIFWYLKDKCYTTDEEAKKVVACIDPEDPAIYVWEILPSGHRKIVWAYMGWHHEHMMDLLDQGKFPGHEENLYAETMKEY
jgi:hypothetical protein